MEEIRCPVCGQALGWTDEVYRREGSCELAGCSQCLRGQDVYDWANAEIADAGGAGVWFRGE